MVKDKKNIPEGIWILAIISFVGAIVTAVFTKISFVAIGYLPAMNQWMVSQNLLPVGFQKVVFVSIFLLSITLLGYFMGRGLLKSQNWARIVLGVYMALGIITSVIGLGNGLIIANLSTIIVNGFVVWYLFFKESTKEFFK